MRIYSERVTVGELENLLTRLTRFASDLSGLQVVPIALVGESPACFVVTEYLVIWKA